MPKQLKQKTHNQQISQEKKKIVIITGATGSGKSAIAIEIAKRINGVIINADSMQIYTQIPIISAQPSVDDFCEVKHLLYGFVDIFDTNDKYSVGRYLDDLKDVLHKFEKNNEYADKVPIIVGGTMLYIDAMINGISCIPEIPKEIKADIRSKYCGKKVEDVFNDLAKIDKKYANIVDKNNPHRLLRGIEVKIATGKSIIDFWNEQRQDQAIDREKYNIRKFLIDIPRDILYDRINLRFESMIANGAIDEVRKLYDYCKASNIPPTALPKAIGICEFFDYFDGKISIETAIEMAKQASRNYAKRQLTWFRNRFQDFIKTDASHLENIVEL